MPGAVAAAAKFVIGLLTAKTVVGVISRVAFSAIITSVSAKLFSPDVPKRTGLTSRDVTTRGALEYRKVVYGTSVVSGPIVYGNTSGNQNEELWYVIPLCHGKSEALDAVWFDGDRIPAADIDWTPGVGSADGTGTGEVSTAKWVGENATKAVRIYWYLGDDLQPASGNLDTAFLDIDTNFRLRGITYMILRLRYNKDTELVWADGLPRNFKAEIRGKLVYDSRKDSTNGGTGLHRFTDETTWEFSDNPALCTANYLMQFMAVDPATSIVWPDVASAADDCDVLVSIPVATTEKRFTCNGALSLGQTHVNNLEAIKSSMAGQIAYGAGQWRIRASTFQASTVTLEEDDIIGPISDRGSKPGDERKNTINPIYVDPNREHQAVPAQSVTAAEFTTRDGGKVLDKDIELAFTNSEFMAQRIGFRELEQYDNQEEADLLIRAIGANIIAGQTIAINHSTLGWVAKTFRVLNWTMNKDGNFPISIREDESARYVDPLEAEYTTKTAGTITLPTVVVAPPTGLTATATRDGVSLSWTNPAARLFETIEIHASDEDDRATAVKIADTTVDEFEEKITEERRLRHFWIRAISFDGRLSNFEPNTTTTTAKATPLPPVIKLLIDPDFKLSTAIPSPFWEEIVVQGGGTPPQTGDVIYRAGLGFNGSDAVDLRVSGSTTLGAETALHSVLRSRVQQAWYEFTMRYTTIGVKGGDHPNFKFGFIQWVSETGVSTSRVSTSNKTLPRSAGGVWTTVRIAGFFSAQPSRTFWGPIVWFDLAPDQDDLRISDLQVTAVGDQTLRSSVTIENPTASEDRSFFFTEKPIRIRKVRGVLRGSASPSVTFRLRHDTDRSATGTLITNALALTSTTTGTNVTVQNEFIPANSFIWLETTAQSGTVNEMSIGIEYNYDLLVD